MKYFLLTLSMFFIANTALAVGPTPIDTASYNITNTTTTSVTFSYTVPNTGENRMLLVSFSSNGGFATSASFNGDSMTEAFRNTPSAFGQLQSFYLLNPDVGAHNLTLNYPSNDGAIVVAFTLQDVLQTSPIDGTVTNGNGGAGTTSRTGTFSTSLDNSYVILLAQPDNGSGAVTINSPQTQIINMLSGWRTTSYFTISGLTTTTAGSHSPGITWVSAQQSELMAFGVKYQAPTGGGGGETVEIAGTGINYIEFALILFLFAFLFISINLVGKSILDWLKKILYDRY